MESTFKKLSEVSLKGKTERLEKRRRDGSMYHLDYLSWSNAWSLLLQHYPDAQRKVYETPDGMNYWNDGRTGFVKVGVTVNGIEHIDYLAIMDMRQQAIPLDQITQFDVVKTIQRSTTKAIALHGLGLQLWTGEDIDPAAENAAANAAVLSDVKAKPVPASAAPKKDPIPLEKGTENWDKVLAYIEQNKSLGVEKIGKNLLTKYSITPELRAEIKELVQNNA